MFKPMRFPTLPIVFGGLFLVALAFGVVEVARRFVPVPGEPPPVTGDSEQGIGEEQQSSRAAIDERG